MVCWKARNALPPAFFLEVIGMRPVKRLLASSVSAFALTLAFAASAWAGNEQVLYQFQTVRDGFRLLSGVFLLNGKIYGATDQGGSKGWGIIYELTPTKSGWAKKTIHDFTRLREGEYPITELTADKAGDLYGTTTMGGRPLCYYGRGCGTVFKLTHGRGGLEGDGHTLLRRI